MKGVKSMEYRYFLSSLIFKLSVSSKHCKYGHLGLFSHTVMILPYVLAVILQNTTQY